MLYAVSIVLALWALSSTWFMIKFLKMIMSLEDILSDASDDFDETIDTLMAVEDSLDRVIQMPIFFENLEIRAVVDSAKNETKLSRVFVRKCIEKLIKKSKERNVLVKTIEIKPEIDEEQIDPVELYNEIEKNKMTQSELQYIKSVEAINQTMLRNTPNKRGITTVFGRSS